jgi:hypothetical protein
MMKTSTGLILVACVVALAMGGCCTATPGRALSDVLDQKLVIVDSNGALSGAVEEGIVFFDRPGQEVIWKHETDGQFLDIEIRDERVFERVKNDMDRKSLKVNPRGHSSCTPYKYTIKLRDKNIDPVIIIRY